MPGLSDQLFLKRYGDRIGLVHGRKLVAGGELMLDHSRFRDPEDHRGLPVGLSLRRPSQAVEFPRHETVCSHP